MSEDVTTVNESELEIPKKKNTIYDLIDTRKANFIPSLGGDHKQYEKLLRSYINEINSKPELGACSPKSIYDGFVKCCELNLEPSSAHGKLYLVDYKGQLNVQVGYQGWLELLWRNPMVSNVYSNAVYEGDTFELQYGNHITYSHIPRFETEILKFTYAVINFKTGDIQIQVARKKEIDESKAASKSSISAYSPWNKYYDSMAKLVPLRKLAKNIALAIRSDDEFINHQEEIPEPAKDKSVIIELNKEEV